MVIASKRGGEKSYSSSTDQLYIVHRQASIHSLLHCQLNKFCPLNHEIFWIAWFPLSTELADSQEMGFQSKRESHKQYPPAQNWPSTCTTSL